MPPADAGKIARARELEVHPEEPGEKRGTRRSGARRCRQILRPPNLLRSPVPASGASNALPISVAPPVERERRSGRSRARPRSGRLLRFGPGYETLVARRSPSRRSFELARRLRCTAGVRLSFSFSSSAVRALAAPGCARPAFVGRHGRRRGGKDEESATRPALPTGTTNVAKGLRLEDRGRHFPGGVSSAGRREIDDDEGPRSPPRRAQDASVVRAAG